MYQSNTDYAASNAATFEASSCIAFVITTVSLFRSTLEGITSVSDSFFVKNDLT